MGLTGVEILMEVEDEFGIKISDDELSRIQHVGELIACVVSKCARAAHRTCLTAGVFYRLRRTLVESLDCPRREIRPAVAFASIARRDQRLRIWSALEEAGIELPALGRSESLVAYLAAAVIALTVGLTTLTGLVTTFDYVWAYGLVFLILGSCAAALASRPWANDFPASCKTVGDAVLSVVSARSSKDGPVGLSEREIGRKLRVIIAEISGVPVDEVTEDKTFAEIIPDG